MSFEAVSERLSELQETNRQLGQLIERLATLRFEPGSIPLTSEEDDSILGELKTEIRQSIGEQFDDFAYLQDDVIHLNRGKHNSEIQAQKACLEQAVQRGQNEVKAHQIEYRRAVIQARKNLNAAKKEEYQLLINSAFDDPQPGSGASSPVPGVRRREKKAVLSAEEREINASSDVTSALRRTHDVMTAELSRSQFAHDTLKESTAALAQLGETYSIMDTMLSSSKNLLGTLLRSQKSDTWYLETAFYVLCATIAWLVFRRFLYGPLWWFLWFPLRIFFRSLIGVLTGVGLIGDGGSTSVAVSSVASVAGTQTVSHRSGTRASRPTVAPTAASVNVGGGGRGSPMRPRESQGQGAETVSELVGRIIEDSQNPQEATQDSVEEDTEATAEEQSEGQKNPKKRMWEEDKEAAKEASRARDEL